MFIKKEMAYKWLIVRMVVASLFLSVVLGFLASLYLKEKAIGEMARNDAKKTSELVFQGLYSAMAKGWTRDDLHSIVINAIEGINKEIDQAEMIIQNYRADEASEVLNAYNKARIRSEKIKRKGGLV